jgi:hypothetical protein
MFEQDIDTQADVAQYIRKIFGTAPLKSIVGDELTPGLDVLPGNASSSAWDSWIKANCKLPTFDRTQEASLTISRPT